MPRFNDQDGKRVGKSFQAVFSSRFYKNEVRVFLTTVCPPFQVANSTCTVIYRLQVLFTAVTLFVLLNFRSIGIRILGSDQGTGFGQQTHPRTF